jgi:hypothetical protein
MFLFKWMMFKTELVNMMIRFNNQEIEQEKTVKVIITMDDVENIYNEALNGTKEEKEKAICNLHMAEGYFWAVQKNTQEMIEKLSEK